MPQHKSDGIMSLNVKKLLILHLVRKTNRILQCESLFFIMQLILMYIWRDNLPKHGRPITKSFLGTALTMVFGASILSKFLLMHFLPSHGGSCFYTKYFSIHQPPDEIW